MVKCKMCPDRKEKCYKNCPNGYVSGGKYKTFYELITEGAAEALRRKNNDTEN